MKRQTLLLLVILTVFMLTGNSSPLFSQEAEKTFQKGLVKEEGEGSLKEAIELYNLVVENELAERPLRAKALLHVGICYEKLGQENAKKAYQRLIVDFADQGDVVAIGKKNLAFLDTDTEKVKSSKLTIRQVWAPAEDTYGVLPDGRYLTYIDWYTIAVVVKDLKTGKTWDISDRGTWKPPSSWPDNSLWSPDGKQIAYYWFTADGESTEIRIVNPDGSDNRLLCTGARLPWPVDWSPDGKYLLAINTVKDEDKPLGHYDQIVMVSTKDGSITILKTFDDLHINHLKFSPDGQYIALNLQQEIESDKYDIHLLATDGSEEKKIVPNPANDKNVEWTRDGTGILFLSDRQGTTDLWSLKLDQGEPELVKSDLGERTKLLGVTNDQSLFYAQEYSRSDLFRAELDFTSGEVLSRPVRISINDVMRSVNPSWSPNGRYIAYFSWAVQDYQLGNRYVFVIHDTQSGTNRKITSNLYGIPQDTWAKPRWSGDGKSLLVNGATKDMLRGYYLVNVESGKETPVLVTKTEPRETKATGYFHIYSRDGKDIYYVSKDNQTILKRNLESEQEETIFSSKDLIASFGISPDESQIILALWLNERNVLYTIPSSGGELKKLSEFKENQSPYVISWTPDNEFVLIGVITSKDPASYEIMRIPVNGGEPEPLFLSEELFTEGVISDISVHPDGKQVLFTVESNSSVIWALENMFRQ